MIAMMMMMMATYASCVRILPHHQGKKKKSSGYSVQNVFTGFICKYCISEELLLLLITLFGVSSSNPAYFIF